MTRLSVAVRTQLAQLRQPLRAAVQATAKFVAERRRGTTTTPMRRKGFADFVTAIDVTAERRLRRELMRMLPAAGFLGEESAPSALAHPFVWVVDPIDGTSNFARGLPHYAIAVALLYHHQPVLACIHAAPELATYEAEHQRGAYCNGRRLRIPRGRSDDGAIFGCQWRLGTRRIGFLARLQQSGARVRLLGSTVIQLLAVAAGRLDGNVQEAGRVWDLAAPGLVVVEAGGRFTDWRGRPLLPFAALATGHCPSVAAAPAVHREILRRLRG